MNEEKASEGIERFLFVVSAPSGTGKTTICQELVAYDPELMFSISHTTRDPRGAERDGVDYHFVSREVFRTMVEHGAFLEHAEYRGHLYGTSWKALREPMKRGFDVLLEIEIEGARQVRERLPVAVSIFVLPPSLEELARRLRGRKTDAEAVIAGRLEVARRELCAVRDYDYVVVNDELARAVEDVASIIRGVRAGRREEMKKRFGCEVVLSHNPELAQRIGVEHASLQ